MAFSYEVVRLWERPAEEFLAADLGVAPLAIAQTFTTSTESLSRRISEVYTTNLDRPVDPAGLAFWLSHAEAIGGDV